MLLHAGHAVEAGARELQERGRRQQTVGPSLRTHSTGSQGIRNKHSVAAAVVTASAARLSLPREAADKPALGVAYK